MYKSVGEQAKAYGQLICKHIFMSLRVIISRKVYTGRKAHIYTSDS